MAEVRQQLEGMYRLIDELHVARASIVKELVDLQVCGRCSSQPPLSLPYRSCAHVHMLCVAVNLSEFRALCSLYDRARCAVYSCLSQHALRVGFSRVVHK